jgi:hypothetical protein
VRIDDDRGHTMMWDRINNLFANQWFWFGAAGILVVLVWVAATKFRNSKPSEAIPDQQDGWTPTGRIDFLNPQSMGNFILQAEDTRIIESLGGVEHREIRWRKATLDEAKTVVVAYHAQRNLTMAANFIVNSSIRQKSDLDNEHQNRHLGKDEAPHGKSQV